MQSLKKIRYQVMCNACNLDHEADEGNRKIKFPHICPGYIGLFFVAVFILISEWIR